MKTTEEKRAALLARLAAYDRLIADPARCGLGGRQQKPWKHTRPPQTGGRRRLDSL